MKFNHRHPLTLLNNGGELLCPNCHRHLDGSYRCRCHPHSIVCFLCNENVSGSCYTCEKCWENSTKCRKCPLVHQSCFELQEEIQISYRPGCLLFLFEENAIHCHFCNRKEGRYQYICGDCGFCVCFGCVSKLIKYHEGQEQVNHFSHRHPLTSLNLDDMNCKFCNEGIDGPAYGCAPCKFYIHNSCRVEFSEEIDHHFHPKHSLAFEDLTLSREKENHFCEACRYEMQGLGCRCDECDFDLHAKCTTLKANIKYEGHPHLLILVENLDSKSRCEACHLEIRGVFYMRCVECRLDFHVQCDPDHPLPPTVLYKEHEYRLIHINEALAKHDSQLLSCNVCGKDRNPEDPFYRCAKSENITHVRCIITEVQCDNRGELKYFSDIHNSYGSLQQEIWHPFHPRHALTLLAPEHDRFRCDACRSKVQDLRYRCEKCEFDLHPECTSLKADIQYKGHQHPLILVENMSHDCQCEACGCDIQGDFFLRCVECDLYFHLQCGPLPLPSSVYEKHGHPLTISKKRLAKVNSSQLCCGTCNKAINPEHPIYYCDECEYHAHIRCVITKARVDERKNIKHFSHEHLLFLFENKRNINCVACGKSIQASPAYGCDQCEFYLHQSCVDLPREIQHPFHLHPLSLPKPYRRKSRECHACGKHHYALDYGCQDCNFYLDLDCSLIFPSIKIPSFHEHTLTFFTKLYDKSNCHVERGCIIGKNKSIALDDWYLRCVQCNFNLHLLCCQLPTSFKHDCHPQHSLNLKDNFGGLFVDDFEDEEYCCDFCEKRRDARECVYHCKECNFVVDFECLFSEIIQFLEGKRKDAEFTTVRRKITKKIGLTYNDILESLTEEENKVGKLSISLEEMMNDGTSEDMFDDLKAVNYMVSRRISFAWKNFKAAVSWQMWEWEGYLEEDANAELVRVGEYKISPKLAPILNKLLEKYGDFVACCSLTQSLKTVLLTTLCRVMQEMRHIELKNITSGLLVSWWILFKLLQRVGFSIDFVLEHVKGIAAKYFFLINDSSSVRSNPFYEPYEKIALHSKEVELRRAEIEILNKEINYKLSNHDSDERSRDEATRFNQALGSWWKNVTDGLLDDIPES